MKRYEKRFNESIKGNFYGQKISIKESFKNIKIIEEVQMFFEKGFKSRSIYATLTPSMNKYNTIVGWNLYFKIDGANLDKIMVEQVVNEILSISSKLSVMASSNDSFSFNLEI
jgi:hypothetical protein